VLVIANTSCYKVKRYAGGNADDRLPLKMLFYFTKHRCDDLRFYRDHYAGRLRHNHGRGWAAVDAVGVGQKLPAGVVRLGHNNAMGGKNTGFENAGNQGLGHLTAADKCGGG
jgi:hypothetical protein